MLLGSLCTTDHNQMVCAVGDGKCNILDRITIDLSTPAVTLKKVIDYFDGFDDLAAIGVSSFGPLELRTYSSQYGYIKESSRENWQNVNLLGTLRHHFKIPISFTTDVNSRAYGEYIQSILQDDPILALSYITISDGVGVGIVNDGKFVGTMGSPEIGHIIPQRHVDDMDFPGVCPYQSDCLEGLVSTPAIEARMGQKPEEISMFNPIWDIVAYYIAQSLVQTTVFVRPQKIILGGSIVNEIELQKVKEQFKQLLNNYLNVGDVDQYITLPSCDEDKLAIIGNLALAKQQFYSQEVR
ncbi:ROK family protein [Apilactobacillus apinorum]|uniref:ROK family protein n=1 Tax=Apilactobacillus apinorum TaxID=1218495 RepID=UPI0006B55C71|nr:ROK family protein [Apilactobacillus apinorum]KOY69842.1 Branched chain amino acid: 2-keto-4-methylthiobutyrate aminotransferase / fructokinase [Apilactobacillus apinorum]CAI2612952.1 Branched chain amino acid: 2-keto-4-methylthiobutyrate aminotransferase / fructokinase [Apilactobacillus apinorum]